MNKLILNFADWLLRTPLLELASERNESISKIKSYSDTLNRHLFKLYVFQKSCYRQHWEDEIYNYIYSISDINWGKKHNKFEEYQYFDWLFYDYFNKGKDRKSIKRLYKNILEKYQTEEIINWSELEFYNLCENFYKLICPILEKGNIDKDFDKIIKTFEIE